MIGDDPRYRGMSHILIHPKVDTGHDKATWEPLVDSNYMYTPFRLLNVPSSSITSYRGPERSTGSTIEDEPNEVMKERTWLDSGEYLQEPGFLKPLGWVMSDATNIDRDVRAGIRYVQDGPRVSDEGV